MDSEQELYTSDSEQFKNHATDSIGKESESKKSNPTTVLFTLLIIALIGVCFFFAYLFMSKR